MRKVRIAASQMACSPDTEKNVAEAERLIRLAAAEGAQVILIQELFETPYFCQDRNPAFFVLARPVVGSDSSGRKGMTLPAR